MRKSKKLFFGLWISLLLENPLVQAVQIEKSVSLIPAGEFIMGTKEGAEIERPVHKVYLKE